jgi:hypothetical protein
MEADPLKGNGRCNRLFQMGQTRQSSLSKCAE